jgi:hypothetical protein
MQVYATVSLDEPKQDRKDLQRSVPFWKLIVKKIQMMKQLNKKVATDQVALIIPQEQPAVTHDSDEIAKKEKDSNASDTVSRLIIPAGYRLCNVPGDGLCGYWATLAAKKAHEFRKERTIKVEKKEVFELLKKLSDYVAYIVGKKNKTDREIEMGHEIEQLQRDGYVKNNEDLCQKLEKGKMQLDSPLTIFLAETIGYNIILEWEGIKAEKNVHVQERYQADNAEGTIIIYYSGNGSGGHYQAIIPNGINVNFNQ